MSAYVHPFHLLALDWKVSLIEAAQRILREKDKYPELVVENAQRYYDSINKRNERIKNRQR